jgi:hypothetical protein
VLAEKGVAAYFDESLRSSNGDAEQNADFVTAFADKIPHTHGAPKREFPTPSHGASTARERLETAFPSEP